MTTHHARTPIAERAAAMMRRWHERGPNKPFVFASVVRKSLVDERFDVSVPCVRFLDRAQGKAG